MRPRLFFILFAFLLTVSASAQLSSPDQFLGYGLGSRYTPHHRIVSYFRQLAQAIPTKIRLENYGETNEGRPLIAAFVSSPRNIARLDAIRSNNLALARQGSGNGNITDAPVIVWLSYNVHGNETSSSEAAMKTLYELLQPGNQQAAQWLEHVVVVIDPCLNPDGRDRYVNWFNSIVGANANPLNAAREHSEPWPGGRVNHYYFDLNRDWAWQTQVETKARVKLYRQWMPQVHVDFHEQGINNPYYFAPAAEPYHEVITPWQRKFQETIGRNHAKYFDQNGWLYFTREVFDLFYPAYGDTYPLYNGAIGMTYEQAGGPAGGLASITETGDTLRLRDRIAHHYTTGMSTIEVSAANAQKMISEFQDYFNKAVNVGFGSYKTYVIKYREEDKARINSLIELLDNNGVRYSSNQSGSLHGYDYETGKQETFSVTSHDLVISGQQPSSALARVLFEPNSKLSDSVTYDITAWSLPYAYGLKAYASGELTRAAAPPATVEVQKEKLRNTDAYVKTTPGEPYAYIIPWVSSESAHIAGLMLQYGLHVRFAQRPFQIGNKTYDRGTLLLMTAGNNETHWWSRLLTAAWRSGVQMDSVASTFVDGGANFGSASVRPLIAPKVAVLSGEGVSPNALGEVWHYFEQELKYPVTLVNTSDFGRVDWSRFTVVILPNGNYRFLNDKTNADALRSWVNKGGRLIALEGAVSQLAGLDWGLKARKADEPSDATKVNYGLLRRYEDRERDEIPNFTPGSIYRVELDNSHPLAFGYPSRYYTLRQDDHSYEFLAEGGWNVGVIKKEKPLAGFVGNKLQSRLQDALVFGVQDLGNGNVVYLADDVLFRDFWENGKLLFANAVFLVGQ
jgi:hypothetical protein